MFQHRLLSLPYLLLLLTSATFSQTSTGSPVGRWELPQVKHGNVVIYVFNIQQNNGTYTGTWSNTVRPESTYPLGDIKVTGNEIRLRWLSAAKTPIPLAIVSGKIYGDRIAFVMEDDPARPGARIGEKHSMTGYRDEGNKFIAWLPEGEPSFPFDAVSVPTAPGEAKGLTGRWEAPFAAGAKSSTYDFAFEEHGGKLTGNGGVLGGTEIYPIGNGQIHGHEVSFDWMKDGHPVAHFSGTQYGDDIALLVESVPGASAPGIVGGSHPVTAIRNVSPGPWYTWISMSWLDKGKAGVYSTLAKSIYQMYQKQDMTMAATLSDVLNYEWDCCWKDHGIPAELHDSIDTQMDQFIMPIITYKGGMPDPAMVEAKYKLYLAKLALVK